MAKTLVLVLLALVGSLAQAQHVRWDNTATTTTGVGQMLPVLALPGASISFYTGCTALPCATPAVTYQSASGVSCPSNAQVVWQAAVGTGCHATADSEGNFGGWFAPGDYQYTITINSTTAGPYDFAAGSGGGTPVMNLQHNSSTTGINQTIYNLCDNGSCGPALDAGMQQVVAKTGAGDGSWVLETAAAAGSIQPTYQVPVAGQHIIMLPYSCSGSGAGFTTPVCGAAPGYSMSLSIYQKAPFGTGSITDTGWAYNGVEGLPSFVSAANVTAVYGGVTSWWTGGSYQTSCGGVIFDAWSNGTNTYPSGLPGHYPYTATTVLTQIDGGSPTTFNYTTAYLTLANQQSTICSGTSTRVAIPYLIVYYTGTAPPASTNLTVAQPLTLTNNTLGFLWPNNEALDTGTSTAYAISIPWMTSANLTPGADIWVDPANTNTTTTPTLNLNGGGPVGILGPGAGAVAIGDAVAGQMAHFVWGADGEWHLQNGITGGSGGGLSGMTAGQVPIAATATTVTSSKALAGTGAGITTGPTSTTLNDCVKFGDAAGTLADAGAACGAGGGAFSGGLGTNYQDVTEIAAPANPAAGNDRLYLNSTTHLLACLTSGGANCMPSGGSGAVSGQVAGTIPIASSATALTGPSHISEAGGIDTVSQPLQISSSGPSFTQYAGLTSGSAYVGAAAAAGTPSTILLPTSNPLPYQQLQAASPAPCASYGTANCAQTSWANPMNWPPAASGPTLSPAPGLITSGTTVTAISCPGTSTAYISLGSTPIAGATGVAVSTNETVYGSCQGGGYFLSTAGAYTVNGWAEQNDQFANSGASSVTTQALPAFTHALQSSSCIVVMVEGAGGSTFSVTDTAGNTYADAGPGTVLWNGGTNKFELFAATNTSTTASDVVTLHQTNAGQFFQGEATEWTGTSNSCTLDATGSSTKSNGTGGASGANALTIPAVATATNGDLVIGAFIFSTGPATPGTSPNAFSATCTTAAGCTPNAMQRMEYFVQGTAGSIGATAGDTTGSDLYGGIQIPLKP